MSTNTVNKGAQVIGFQYQENAQAKLFNRTLSQLLPVGIYSLSSTVASPSGSPPQILNINPLTVFIRDNNLPALSIVTRIETTTAQAINFALAGDGAGHVDVSKPYIVLRWGWSDQTNNYLDFVLTTYSFDNTMADPTQIWPNDIILGKLLFDPDGSNPGKFFMRTSSTFPGWTGVPLDLSRTGWAFPPDSQTRYDELKTQSSEVNSKKVYVTAGSVKTGRGLKAVTGGDYGTGGGTIADTLSSASSKGRIDLVYIDDLGAVQILEGTNSPNPSTDPVAPPYLDRKVIAEIRRGGSRTTIEGPDIVQIKTGRNGAEPIADVQVADAGGYFSTTTVGGYTVKTLETALQQLGASRAALKAWSSTYTYAVGEVAVYRTNLFLAIATSTNVTPGSDASKWTLLTATAYDSGQQYQLHDRVIFNDQTWYATTGTTNTNHTPTYANETFWAPTAERYWNITQTYALGDQVFWLGEKYISLQGSNTGNVPSSAPTFWQQQTTIYDWNSAVTYGASNSRVWYNGFLFSVVAGSTNVTPGTDSTKWRLETIAPWRSTQTYSINDIVAYNGGLYTSLNNSNLNNQPDITGQWSVVTGSGGSSDNYITNGQFTNNANGWATYIDAAGVDPVDGTGGVPNSTFARNIGSPLFGIADGLWTKTGSANRQGEGFSYAFTIDSGARGQPFKLEFYYKVASGTYADNDMGVYIYDVTNSVFIPLSLSSLVGGSGGVVRYIGFWMPGTSTSYRLVVHTKTTSTQNYSLQFDKFFTGIDIPSYTVGPTPWTAYTPTISGLSGFTQPTYYYRRVGENIEIRGRAVAAGAISGTSPLISSLPAGLTFNQTYQSSNTDMIIGQSTILDNAVQAYGGFVVINSTTQFSISFYNASATTLQGSTNMTATAPFTWGVNDEVNFWLSAPIIQWSSPLQLSTESVEYSYSVASTTTAGASDTSQANTRNSPDGVAFNSINSATGSDSTTLYRCYFNNPVNISDEAILEISSDRVHWTNAKDVYPWVVVVGGFRYGVAINLGIGTNYVEVLFGNGGRLATTTYNAAGNAWSGASAHYWRVKLKRGGLVGTPPKSYARYIKTGTQALTGSDVIVNFDSKDVDTHSTVTTGASWKFTAPTKSRYLIRFFMNTGASSNTISVLVGSLYKNGSFFEYIDRKDHADSATGISKVLNGTTVLLLNPGDFIDIRIKASADTQSSVANEAYITIADIGQ